MKTVVIASKPKKINLKDLFLIADQIKTRQGLKKKAAQTRFEESEKNKILLRLMHMASPKKPTWFVDSFPLELNAVESLKDKMWYKNINTTKNTTVSVELAYKNIARFLDNQGFNCSIKISKQEKDRYSKNVSREIKLFCHGVKE